MSAALEVVGFLATGALDLIGLLDLAFPPKKVLTTVIKITMGMTLGDLSASLSGNMPGVAMWDELGQHIGTVPGTSEIVPQGNIFAIEMPINDKVGNVRPAYVSITNGGTDAICITGFTMTFPDDTKAAWNAGVAMKCGAQIFLSQTEFGEGHKKPPCVWIDRDNSLGLKYQGFGLHIGDFFGNPEQGNAYAANSDLLCKSGPRFRMYEKLRAEDPILTFQPALEYDDDHLDKNPARVIENPGVMAQQNEELLRQICEDPKSCKDLTEERCKGMTPRVRDTPVPCKGRIKARGSSELNSTSVRNNDHSWPLDSTLVVSANEHDSARFLCEHQNTWGPPLVSLAEGLLCDMQSKTLYKLCSEAQESCCFDLDAKEKRACSNELVQRRGLWRTSSDKAKIYTDVRHWG